MRFLDITRGVFGWVRILEGTPLGRARAKRPPEKDEPPAAAGVRSPLLPRTPVLSGANARPWPPTDSSP
ncbi:MAG TPA: hypothetical protein VMH02_12390 [Verrucomicrobiae bacterium]|nr:hypothetical protein [Verrucomicrobiae bacterium]